MRKVLLRVLVPVLAAALLLAGVIVLGRSARDALRQEDRYALPFADIDCDPPPGEKRPIFLSEVQYLGEQPEKLPLLDEDLPARLARAFARHPWVEKVEGVEVLPSHQVRVRLVYRTPVLVVLSPAAGIVEGADNRRAAPLRDTWVPRLVDGHGALLPPSRLSTDDLPTLKLPDVPPPARAAGAPWGDRRVEAAARTAGLLHPHRDRLRIKSVEVSEGNLVLRSPPATVVRWGHPPGEEADGEAPAARKLERLLDYCKAHGGLGSEKEPCDLDLRSR